MKEYKYEQIIETILKELDSRTWLPGEKIASERDLVIRYGVSRITIKKAIEELISGGYLIRYPQKRGTFVNPHENKKNQQPARLIGVAIDDVSDSFGASLSRGIEDYLWDQKIHTVICNGDRNFKKVEEYFNSLLKNNIDGVIFSPVIAESNYNEKNLKILELLENRKVPYVLVDRTIDGIDSNFVSTNHRESTALLTSSIIKAGHKNILLLKGLPCSSMNEREKGYREAMSEAGERDPGKWIIPLNDNHLFKKIEIRELEKLEKKISSIGNFTAVVALNNRVLKGFIMVMDTHFPGWRNIITIGIHDKLTLDIDRKEEIFQIIQPTYEVGREAARLLTQTIEEKSTTNKRIILRSSLVTGMNKLGSCI